MSGGLERAKLYALSQGVLQQVMQQKKNVEQQQRETSSMHTLHRSRGKRTHFGDEVMAEGNTTKRHNGAGGERR